MTQSTIVGVGRIGRRELLALLSLTMALTALSAYTVEHTLASVALVSVVFCLVNLPSCASWVTLGQQMRRFLTSPARLRAFNWTMAALLVLTLIPILRGH